MLWYEVRDMHQAATTFHNNIEDTISLIHSMPEIGMVESQSPDKVYCSYPAHKLCRIYYWFDAYSVFIANLRFTRMLM